MTVPIQLDIEPAATNVGGSNFDLHFASATLTIDVSSGVSLGADTVAGWGVSAAPVGAGQLRVGLIDAGGRTLTPGLREIAQLRFHVAAHVAASVPDAGFVDGMISGLGEAGLRGAPLAAYGVSLDVEPVDPRAGGYVWTAVDGSLAFAQAEGGRDAESGSRARRGQNRSDETVGDPHDWPYGSLRFEFEDVLAEIADDIAWAWR